VGDCMCMLSAARGGPRQGPVQAHARARTSERDWGASIATDLFSSVTQALYWIGQRSMGRATVDRSGLAAATEPVNRKWAGSSPLFYHVKDVDSIVLFLWSSQHISEYSRNSPLIDRRFFTYS